VVEETLPKLRKWGGRCIVRFSQFFLSGGTIHPVKNPEVYVGFFGATLEQVKDGSELVSATVATT